MDQRVDAGRLEGIAADQQWMKRQDLAQLFVLDELRDKAVHRAIRLQAHQIGDDFDHVPGPAKWHVGQLGEAFIKDTRGAPDELLVTGHILRCERLESGRSSAPRIRHCSQNERRPGRRYDRKDRSGNKLT